MILCVFHVHWLELCLLRSSNLFIHVDKVSDLGFWIKPSVKLGLVQWHDPPWKRESTLYLFGWCFKGASSEVANWMICKVIIVTATNCWKVVAKCGWLRSWQICEESQRRRLQRDIVSQHHFGCPCKGKDLRNVWLRTIEPPMDYGRSMAFPFCPWADHVKHPTLDLGGSPQVAWGLLGRSGLFSWPLISVANDDATTATASCQGSLVFYVIHRCVS